MNLRNTPWPCLVFLLAIAMPPDLSVQLASLRLSAYRVVLIVFLIPAIRRLYFREKSAVSAVDALMLIHVIWAMSALVLYAGISQGVETGGIYGIEALGAYLVARAYVTTLADLRHVARWVISIVAVLIGFAFAEAITGNHFIRQTSRNLLGGVALPDVEPRLGLHRAFTSFDHPILFGIFCAGFIGIAFYLADENLSGFRRYRWSCLLGAATFFSLSSGAFSAAGVQYFLIGYDRLTTNMKHRWYMLGTAFAGVWVGISFLSNRSPIKVFLTYFTFSPGTGYGRLRIWEYRTAEVARHPLFGIGLGEWERPDWMVSSSIDNFWLATAMRYGLPAFLFLMTAVCIQVVALVQSKPQDSSLHGAQRGWLISMMGLCVAGITVHYWNALFCVFCFMLGLGAGLTKSTRPAPAENPAESLSHDLSPSETIFLFLRPGVAKKC